MLKNIAKIIKKEFKSHTVSFFVLVAILAVAFFIRVYRVGDLLQFYYDQGRDALVIWKLWNEGKPFLIGPVTGLSGIFLGPAYYYLIAPFYLIGGGDPSYPAVFLVLLSVIALLLLYVLGAKMHSRKAGFIALFIGSFSYYLFTNSRWLSNPNPMYLISMLFFWSLWEITNWKIENKKWKMESGKWKLYKWWIIASLLVGLSLQFESASGVFYIPIFAVFALWQYRKLPNFKYIVLAGLAFLTTLTPQLIFNFRHDNIIFDNFGKLFFEEKAFKGVTKFIFEERMKYFWSVFSTKLLIDNRSAIVITTISLSTIISSFSKFKSRIIPLFAIFILIPMAGYILFQGNHGNIYDYYMIGFYLPMILLFSIGLGELLSHKLGFVFVGWFFYMFFAKNLPVIKNYITATEMTRPIAIEDQKKAVGWIQEDLFKNNINEFNVDVYVPPVIPHSYDYLFLWLGKKECGENFCGLEREKLLPVLYTIYEEDPPHPERLEVWMERQESIGKIEEETKFGQVTVQRRKRL